MVIFRSIHVSAGPSGAGTVTYTDTGGPTGLTPVAAIVRADVVTALDTNTQTARISEGYYDGTTQRCCAVVCENNTAAISNDVACFNDTAKVVVIGDTTGGTTPALTGAAAGFGVNTLDITWDAALPNARLDIILVYGGIVRARATSLASSSSIGGTASTTGGPAKPSMVFAATTGKAFSSGGASAGGGFSSGFAGRLPSTSQGCSALVWEDNASPTSVGNINRDDAVCTLLTNGSTEGTRIEVNGSGAWNSDGVTFTTRNAAVSIEFMVLELYLGDERRVWAGGPLLNTDTAGAFSRTDPGFRPQALFFSHTRTAVINTVGNTQGVMGLGFVSANSQGNISVFSRDNQATSDAQTRHSDTQCAQIIQTAGAATMRFAWTSFDATGWSGSVSTASAADFYVPYCAIEDISELQASDTENLTDQHAMMVGLAQSETENITDQHAFGVGLAQSETENLTDQHALMVGLAQSEIENLTDEHALMVGMALSETEDIADEVVLISLSISNAVLLVLSEDVSLVEDEDLYLGYFVFADDTESIVDGDPAMAGFMSLDDTVNLLEGQNFNGTALIVTTDSVELTDTDLVYLGLLLIDSDTENITEFVNFGRGLIATHGTDRGTTLQGGAEAGAVLGAHAERGTSLG